MTDNEPVGVATTVDVAPVVAFEIFVEEIDRWWRPGRDSWRDPVRAIGMRFERGGGGRWIERYDEVGDDAFVIGEITGWNPGVSMTLDFRGPAAAETMMPIGIGFDSAGGGTRVTIRHDAADRGHRQGPGWKEVLEWFRDWTAWGSPRRGGVTLADRHAYVLQPNEGLDGDSAAKATRRSTTGSLSITESVTTGGAPLHVHRHDDEVFYVLDGTMTVTLDGETRELAPGGLAYIPRGVPHAWDTIGEARVLIVSAPGGLEAFPATLHAWPNGYADAWRTLGERHGYTLL